MKDSDSDSTDSDEGIRYKTESIRSKYNTTSYSTNRELKTQDYKSRDRSRERRRQRSRSKSSERRRDYGSSHKLNSERRKSKERTKSRSSRHERDKDDSSKLKRRLPSPEISSKSKNYKSERKKESETNKINQLPKEIEKKDKQEREYSSSTREKEIVGPALPLHLLKKDENESIKIQKRDCEDVEMVSSSNSDEENALPLKKEDLVDHLGPALPPNLESKECIGPELPPHLKKQSEDTEKASVSIGPALPPHLLQKPDNLESKEIVGPDLPPHLKKQIDSENESIAIGPALPPHLLQTATADVEKKEYIGPELPPHLRKQEDTPEVSLGPALPPHLREKLAAQAAAAIEETIDDSEEDEAYGPLPPGVFNQAQIALEERALQMKIDKLNPEDKKQGREEWMLELPAAKAANFGLGPRQFRAKAGPDLSDRSSWTDTPLDKAKKKAGLKVEEVDLRKEAELKELQKRDEQQEKISKKHKKKESLVEMHTKKLKKEKHKEQTPGERRPFNRETDLQVNRFDEAQKKAILKKAQLLDDRFSKGESKYL